jgi:hypothetical protein
MAVNSISIVWFLVKGRQRVILKAKWDAIKGIPAMWKKRKEIQARRVVDAREIRKLVLPTIPWVTSRE